MRPVAAGLNTLVSIDHAGDDRLFLSEQNGKVSIFDGGSLRTFLDLSGLTGTGFEGGLKSLAFHPEYASNGRFFVHYVDVLGDSVIARYEVSRDDPEVADPSSAATLMIVDQEMDLHLGGQIAFGLDGYLYTAFGDGGPQNDPECHAQRPDTLQGKLLRIDVDQNVGTPPYYGIPPDNPFAGGRGEPAPEVWAVGFRQPWRFSFDRQTGDLYLGDVGQHRREEVNVLAAGAAGGQNFGWPIMEGTWCHDPLPVDPDCPAETPPCDDPSYAPPWYEYPHEGGSCSVTGGFVYRGPLLTQIEGHYLFGDYCTGEIWAISLGGRKQELSISLPGVITFGEDAVGNLYLSNGSELFRIEDAGLIFADGFESGDTAAW